MHTQHSTTSLFYHPLHRLQYKLKHGINGTTKRNNNHIEDKKAPNIKQKSVQAKQTDCMMYTHHLQLGLGMICSTVPCIQIQSLFFTTVHIYSIMGFKLWCVSFFFFMVHVFLAFLTSTHWSQLCLLYLLHGYGTIHTNTGTVHNIIIKYFFFSFSTLFIPFQQHLFYNS